MVAKTASKRIIIFDLIRFFAIGLIIYVHVMQKYGSSPGVFFGLKNFYYISLGGLGVTIMLVLSGVVIELSYGKKIISFSEFLRKRAQKIYFVYWLSLLFALVALYFTNHKNFNPAKVILNLTGLQVFTGQSWSNFILPVSWYIGLIMFLYFLFPIISKTMQRNKNLTLFSLLLISVASRFFIGKYWTDIYRPLDWFPLCRIFEFGLGIWIAQTTGALNFLKKLSFFHLNKLTELLAQISFPAFLIHYPLLFIINKNYWSIPAFLSLTFIFSWLVFYLDFKIQQIIQKPHAKLLDQPTTN